MTLHGADAATVDRALDRRTPLVGADGDAVVGCRGFAGALDADSPSGTTLVRDVLGRYPVFSDTERPGRWAFSPQALSTPELVPAGTVRRSESGRWVDERVWELPEGSAELADPATAGARLDGLLGAVFDDVLAEPGETAVAFSGGVDSALVADALDAPCYVVGFPDSQDVAAARESADAMGLDLRVVELTHEDIERAVPAVARATARTNPMDVSIALPLYLAGEAAAADGFDRLAVGQGADELFGGYQKVVAPDTDHRVEADTVRGARRETMLSLPEQLPRDVLALRAAGVEPVAPLLDDRVVAFALELAGHCLVDGERRKVALREAAAHRLPSEVAERKKKAVQYGSNVSRELDRLARQAGYKRRMDDHVGKYVRSLR